MNIDIQIRFLGTGTILSGPDRSCSATIIETPGEKILIDIGAGTLRRMAAEGVDIHSIDYIFITHFHPDHIADLVPFLFALKNSRQPGRKSPLRIWGPQGFYNYIESMNRAYGRWLEPGKEEARLQELNPRIIDFPGFRVIWDKTLHSIESVGYRFEIGEKIIAFSGDSGYCPELVRLCQGVHLAVLECSFPDEFAVQGHLSPALAARIGEEAAARRLVLNHFYPVTLQSDPCEIARKYFRGEIIIANDGDVIFIPLDAGH